MRSKNIADIIAAVLDQGSHFHVLMLMTIARMARPKLYKIWEKVMGPGFFDSKKWELGLGTAYIAGFNYGLQHGYDYLFEMDADFSHNPKDLNRLLDGCVQNNAHLAVGSRIHERRWHFQLVKVPIVLSYGASLYVPLLLEWPSKIQPLGLFIYHRSVLEGIDLNKIKFTGYAFQIEMKYTKALRDLNGLKFPSFF